MVIKPRHLKIGDTIGICAPSGPPDPEKLTAGTTFLRNLGFETVFGESVRKRWGYLAGPDEERAEDLHCMFEDPTIDAIFCARGGTGSLRVLSHLDMQRLTGHPKILLGYSDITSLQLALYTKLKWISFYGPLVAVDLVIKSLSGEETGPDWFNMLMGTNAQPTVIGGSPLLGGQARGRLLGGCLSLVRSLCGTEFVPDEDGIVFFWEDTKEDPYRIDLMLAQLRLSGFLDRISAMLIGQLVDCVPRDQEPSLSITDIVLDYCRPLDIPVITDLPFGHGPGHVVMPQGALVEVDGDQGRFTLLETVVS
ncbi:LD-carboxypeptidase [bacterium]|nr:LD-carboxypeptidase [bacterium]